MGIRITNRKLCPRRNDLISRAFLSSKVREIVFLVKGSLRGGGLSIKLRTRLTIRLSREVARSDSVRKKLPSPCGSQHMFQGPQGRRDVVMTVMCIVSSCGALWYPKMRLCIASASYFDCQDNALHLQR